ncbi:hypothetical protein RHMOL_Rhmol12G0120700 [Rhododendron molle]|uniref:Uncharacterized protein n=3 Tax=Rhododendron molle TaxID=49168 RepID=A0ACC0LI32_RHOML|nr:hypothetical protein RHMOL_Rhmol12G0120700 [Rhododendron molle]KAI8528047.1 hypothetical protein RHMOL_Rhmol12G0120700 [Rhododendron molle]KAI8528048.1 hypothetical protein RHMOL_Rhmol12G0120700 [Rhododendron molle]
MEITLKLVNVAFFLVFLTWVLLEFSKRRRQVGEDQFKSGATEERRRRRRYTGFAKITTILSNVLISIFYTGFSSYKFWNSKTIPLVSALSSLTWILSSVVSVCSEGKKWPLVLIVWWVFSSICDLVLVSSYLITHFTSMKLVPYFLPEADIVDLASFPLLILLCFNALLLHNKGSEGNTDAIEHPLLQQEKGNVPKHVFSGAGIWSKVTFMWLNPLFEIGRIQKLELPHIPSVPSSETASVASSLIEESLRKQKTETPSLPRAVLLALWRPLAINGVIAGVNTIASYMGPLLITNFVNFLTTKNDNSSHYHGLILALIFFLAKTVESLSQRQWYFGAHCMGIRIRAALLVLAYKKSLSIKYGGTSNGKVINLVTVDVERIGDFFWYIHGVWLLPFQVILALIILYRNLGLVPSFAALLATISVMVSNTPLASRQERLHSKIMEAKDSRIKATSETLKSMRVLKLHSWESTFSKKIFQLRETERSWLKKYLYTCSAVAFFFWTSPTVVSVVTFGVCIVLQTPLTTGTVLSTLATFRILQEAIYNLPELLSMIAQTKVSIDRMQEFLVQDQKKLIEFNGSRKATDVAIELETGEYSWEPLSTASKKPTINITQKMEIKAGYKVAICGSVGSGKSSLLYSFLDEIPRISGGGINVFGSKAFVPQKAWIQTGTVRETILFGKETKKDFYDDVLEGCALKQDILMWGERDLSVVGERGLNLSGGQKQRIQLARAIYANSDVYFLDDPFSAVDAHTGTHIFKNCLLHLLCQKTVIYVTHQLEFLEAADLVLVMKDGRIIQSGKYEDLKAVLDGELVTQMDAYNKSLNQMNPSSDHKSLTNTAPLEVNEEEIGETARTGGILERTQEEEAETGRVKWRVYSTFIACAYKGALVPVILLCQVFFQGLQIASNYWIAWAIDEKNQVSRERMIGIYALISSGSSIFILGRAVLLSTIAIETSQCLFRGMITSIFRAPLSFFDFTPSSRILSRVSFNRSKHSGHRHSLQIGWISICAYSAVKYHRPYVPYCVASLFALRCDLGNLRVVPGKIQLHFIMFTFHAFPKSCPRTAEVSSNILQCYYITTARELARMVGIRKAPILHHFSESLTGAATIRCFNQEDQFLKKTVGLVDDYSRVAFHNSATMEWLCVRVNFLFNLVFFFVLVILVNLPRSSIEPSLAGLVATYGLNLNVLQAWVVWNLCNVENKMISVERILQFTNIPSEAPLVIENCRLEPEWPINGIIQLENLHVQYDPSLPRILKGITCTFPGNKKIAIVGRTGSGKSTLMQALFRVMEPVQGRILIDGIDISKIGLQDLRSRLSIIPQDPILFQGTMRSNLDPLQQHSDHEIWEVMGKCHLADIVRQDQRLLDMAVKEDGENWSMGQRQLVCLARVLLQRRKILVLDEATASVDAATDNVIQRRIREETSRCTVVTVAHRLPTIIDYDLVLVLDQGKVVEYDSPNELLKDNSSAFSKLVKEFLSRSSNGNHQ